LAAYASYDYLKSIKANEVKIKIHSLKQNRDAAEIKNYKPGKLI